MLFHGRDIYTLQQRGVMGKHGAGDSTPSCAVPVLADAGHLMLPQELLLREAASGAIGTLLTLQAPETLAREPMEVGELLYVVTNERLIAYAKPAPGAPKAMLQER